MPWWTVAAQFACGSGSALVVGDRNDRHVAELVVHRAEVRDVEPAVERRHVRDAEAPRHREVEVVHVPVNEVEASALRRDRLELDDLVRDRIDDGSSVRRLRGEQATSSALVSESPLANRVTSWPSRTSSSVR